MSDKGTGKSSRQDIISNLQTQLISCDVFLQLNRVLWVKFDFEGEDPGQVYFQEIKGEAETRRRRNRKEESQDKNIAKSAKKKGQKEKGSLPQVNIIKKLHRPDCSSQHFFSLFHFFASRE